jgi:hypothetical protein
MYLTGYRENDLQNGCRDPKSEVSSQSSCVCQSFDRRPRLFAVFKLRLSSTQHYVAVAEKLGKWLANDKAYYPEARPQVIPLPLRSCTFS